MMILVLFKGSYSVNAATEWKSITEHDEVIKLEKRGDVNLPTKYSFTPKYIQGKTKISYTYDKNKMTLNTEGTYPAEHSMPGKLALFTAKKKEKNKASVLFNNVGTINDEEISVRLSIATLGERIFVGTNPQIGTQVLTLMVMKLPQKMMTRNNQKLLGEITYLPSENQTPIVFNETLKPIINNQTNQQIDTTIPLLETEKGLRLSLESGNLMGTYGEGIIKWELGDYPKVN